jgi:hypothetical protein
MGQGRLHIYVVTLLLAVLSAIFGMDSVQSQAPTVAGYTSVQSYSDSASVTPLYAPGRPVRVADLLPS